MKDICEVQMNAVGFSIFSINHIVELRTIVVAVVPTVVTAAVAVVAPATTAAVVVAATEADAPPIVDAADTAIVCTIAVL